MDLLPYMPLFVAVAQTRHFGRAAEVLGISPSTLSRRIAELEKALSLRLLNRTTRSVELTQAGEHYYLRCRGIVAEAQQAHESLKALTENPTGTLRVSMPVDPAVDYFAPIIRDFANNYPAIDFDFDLTPRRVDLTSDGFDLAVRMGAPPDTPSTIVAHPLGVIARQLYASPAYLSNAPPLAHPDDLSNHSCLGHADSTLRASWRLLNDTTGAVADVPVTQRFSINSPGFGRALARLGIGIAVLGTQSVRVLVTAGELVRVLPQWSLPPVAVHALTETRLIPARTRLFIKCLREGLAGS